MGLDCNVRKIVLSSPFNVFSAGLDLAAVGNAPPGGWFSGETKPALPQMLSQN